MSKLDLPDGVVNVEFSDIVSGYSSYATMKLLITQSMYNEVYLGYRPKNKTNRLTEYSNKLYNANDLFRLVRICSQSYDVIVPGWMSNTYKHKEIESLQNVVRLEFKFIRQENSTHVDDPKWLSAQIAKLVNDMYKINICSVLEGN